MPRLLVHFARYGAYHRARLRAAAGVLGPLGWDVVGFEIASTDTTYAWDEVAHPATAAGGEPRVVTAFPRRVYDEITAAEYRRGLHPLLANLAPDAMAIAGWGSRDAASCAAWCRRNDVRRIVMSETREADGQRAWWKEWLKRYLVSCFDGALVGGKSHRDYLVKLGMRSDKIRFGYNVVDNEYFEAEAGRVRSFQFSVFSFQEEEESCQLPVVSCQGEEKTPSGEVGLGRRVDSVVGSGSEAAVGNIDAGDLELVSGTPDSGRAGLPGRPNFPQRGGSSLNQLGPGVQFESQPLEQPGIGRGRPTLPFAAEMNPQPATSNPQSAIRNPQSSPPPYFLASNRFIERKNLARLIDAYAGYVESYQLSVISYQEREEVARGTGGKVVSCQLAVGHDLDEARGNAVSEQHQQPATVSQQPSTCNPLPATRNPQPSPIWNLCLLGDGELRDSLIAQCMQLGLNIIEASPWEKLETENLKLETSGERPSVFFPGFRQIEELPRFYAHAGAFVHPAMEEPWGLVINEAMACGLPVLSSYNVGAAEELVDAGVNGWVFDPANVTEMSSCLRKLAELSDDARLTMGEASKRILEERCPTSAFGKGLAEIISGRA
jgi:glycosyltransferase involved in cell wall biosynthesis